ncbi:hypothetical protein SAMN05216404_103249 [Nitrosospira multiformis]|uniref:Uncharacterized protein n=1 Tax=Nitrosospira multiformis TaxID=1231 RepID=A0A1H8F788_9PROT|nr:hypothetical protein SAMN05216404_103249 [Nitrosospira multiformis]
MPQFEGQRLNSLNELVALMNELYPQAVPVGGRDPGQQYSKIYDARCKFMRAELIHGKIFHDLILPLYRCSRSNVGETFGQESSSGEVNTFLSSFGSPEYHPGSEIAREILEPVLNFGGYKKTVTLFEWITLPFNHQITRSSMDEIDFILLVRRLRIMPDGSVILDGHGPMRQRNGKTFSHWPFHGYRTGNAGQYFFNGGFDFQ